MWQVVLLTGLTCVATGCASSFVESADREGAAILFEKTSEVEAFRSDLVNPLDEPAERPLRDPPVEVPELLTLDDAIRIATEHNRDFLARREFFFLDALGLGLTRRDFTKFVFSGSLDYSGSDGSGQRFSDTTLLALSGTRLFPTGGRLTISPSTSVSTFDGGDGREQDASASGSVTFSQPLLRGAGRKVAYEPLTQAERNLVYAARDFEDFRQDFAIRIIQQYLNLVSQKESLKNTEGRVRNQEYALRQARALYRLERGIQRDVFRAEESYRNAQNDLLSAQQLYERAKDSFKIELGLPLHVDFAITEAVPEVLDLDVGLEQAIQAALANRLDLATQRARVEDAERAAAIARNRLLPDLSFSATYLRSSDTANSLRDLDFDDETFSFGLNLEIPLDRKAERNGYRSALISLDQARRSLTQAEDRVILEVRDSLRSLRQQRLSIENDLRNIETLKRQILRADLDNRAGTGSNRDIVEAVDNLTRAENDLLGRRVSYHIARLTLIQQMGLLFVDKEGRLVE